MEEEKQNSLSEIKTLTPHEKEEEEKQKSLSEIKTLTPHEEEEVIFNHSSPERISAVDSPSNKEDQQSDSDDDSDSEFEFPSLIRNPLIPIQNPIYPVFGRAFNSNPKSPIRLPLRKLLIQERNSSVGSSSTSSSDLDGAAPDLVGTPPGLDGVPPESYCVWAPGSAPQSPARCRKSGSTGSLTKWRKISDLVLGRSQSDGKEKFVFLNPKGEKEKEKGKFVFVKGEKEKGKGKKGGGKVTTEVDTVTAHKIFYGGTGVANGVAGGRKSFLPYRQDLVGLFASVNGISRSHHPF